MSRRVLAVLLWGVASWCPAAGAETIHLKDGRTIDAQIIRQTDKTVTIDWYGVPLTYWRDGIVGIEEGKGPQAPAVRPAAGPPVEIPPAPSPAPAPQARGGSAPAAPPAPMPASLAPPGSPDARASAAPPAQPASQTLAVFESLARGARVAYPDGWVATVPEGPSPYVVTIQPKSSEEQAADGKAPVVIELLKYAGASGRFGLEAEAPSDELVDRFLAMFAEGGGRVLRKEPLAVQGGSGWLVEAEGTDPIGVTHHLLISLAAERDVLAVLLCQAPPQTFEAYRALYQAIISRFEPFVYVPEG